MLLLEWALILFDWYPPKKKKLGHRHIQRKTMWGHSRRRPSTSQGQRTQKKPTLPTPWSKTSSLQNCKKSNFCCLSHLSYVTLLWKPRQTNTQALDQILVRVSPEQLVLTTGNLYKCLKKGTDVVRIDTRWSLEGLKVLENWREGPRGTIARVSTEDGIVEPW